MGYKFKHDEENDDHLDDINTIEEEIYPNENQCHLCKLKLASRNDLMDHIEQNHEEYVQGVMEIAERNRTQRNESHGPMWFLFL